MVPQVPPKSISAQDMLALYTNQTNEEVRQPQITNDSDDEDESQARVRAQLCCCKHGHQCRTRPTRNLCGAAEFVVQFLDLVVCCFCTHALDPAAFKRMWVTLLGCVHDVDTAELKA